MKDFIFSIWYLVCRYILVVLPDNVFFQFTNWLTHVRLGFKFSPLILDNPQTFNEKLNYLKKQAPNPQHTILADKILVREFITQTIGEKYLVPSLGIFKSASDINYDVLPNKFILKTNHGSGWNMICKDQSSFNRNRATRLFNRWLSYNAYYLSREPQYKNIQPRIIGEQLLEYEIYDYKFFCFNGRPEFVQVDIDRFSNHKRAFYNLDWEKLPFSIRYTISEKDIPRPAQLEEMKNIATLLSKDLVFSRIDLYLHNDQVYFGEVTLIPGGGNEPFLPKEYDLVTGNLLNLQP